MWVPQSFEIPAYIHPVIHCGKFETNKNNYHWHDAF
jgi:hypothetical protein